MNFSEPEFSRKAVTSAGSVLINSASYSATDRAKAWTVLGNWRASHVYPMNTFNATLRQKIRTIDADAIVAQRLKRVPSILAKLERFDGMQLARMQDIGGLRAIVTSMPKLYALEAAYGRARFAHQLVRQDDYVKSPKRDGYRGIHLIYRYRSQSDAGRPFDGLCLEVQMRTRLQHAWATTVETMGTFVGQALKSGQGDQAWQDFFSLAAATLAIEERAAPVPGYENYSDEDLVKALASSEQSMSAIEKMQGFAIASNHITSNPGKGSYHLVILDSEQRNVSIRAFPQSNLMEAQAEYSGVERRTLAGEKIEAVLVSAGRLDALKKAYPNYFLDTRLFVNRLKKLIT